MTAKEQARYLGTTGLFYAENGLGVPVKITDVRQVFGRTDVEVEPIGGEGTAWVSLERVAIGTNDQEGA